MKKGELKKVAQAYGALIPRPWQRVGNAFMRRDGDWVQIIGFNASRWSDDYEPQNCFEFLKEPGEATGGLLLQGLRHPNGTQRWLNAAKIANSASNDYAPKIFEEMVKQFRPGILCPLRLNEVKSLLAEALEYWPHAYALCVMAAEAGNRAEAERYYAAFLADIADMPYPWAETARQELDACLMEIGSEPLRKRLASIEADKLRALKLAA